MGSPTATTPSSTVISTRVPVWVLSTSMSTLSVITSAMTSPSLTWSPTLTSQVATSPSVMVIDILGMMIGIRAITTP
jgi:hypothetical protein